MGPGNHFGPAVARPVRCSRHLFGWRSFAACPAEEFVWLPVRSALSRCAIVPVCSFLRRMSLQLLHGPLQPGCNEAPCSLLLLLLEKHHQHYQAMGQSIDDRALEMSDFFLISPPSSNAMITDLAAGTENDTSYRSPLLTCVGFIPDIPPSPEHNLLQPQNILRPGLFLEISF